MSARYLVLAGGLSHERDVSLRSGRRVLDALRHEGCEVDLRDADAGLLGALTGETDGRTYDAVLVALHGGAGEDGALREVLDIAGVPHVGATPAACRIAWDKPTAKALLLRAGLSTPPSGTISTAGRARGPPSRSRTLTATSTPATCRCTNATSP